jgi:pimeloyl-ACP methyl ester carboxylesterase
VTPSEQVERWRRTGTSLTAGTDRVFVVDAPPDGAAVAPPLLVVHGFPTSSFDFADVLPRLRTGRRVVLLDLPGYGLSDKPDRAYSLFEQASVVESVVAALGVSEVDLLTHDMGDSVGGELLARGLDGLLRFAIRRRVLTNGSVYLDLAHLTAGQQFLAALPDERLPEDTAPDRDALVTALWATLAPDTSVDDEAIVAAADLVVLAGGNRLLPRLIRYIAERREHEDRWTGAIERHPAPLAIVWGDVDPIADWSMTDRLVERRPDARRTRLARVGHYPMVEVPDAFATAVLDTL